jgi:hypothetical protein
MLMRNYLDPDQEDRETKANNLEIERLKRQASLEAAWKEQEQETD